MNRLKSTLQKYVIIGSAVGIVLVDSVSRLISMLFDLSFVIILFWALSWKTDK